jgi:hypothetical protein
LQKTSPQSTWGGKTGVDVNAWVGVNEGRAIVAVVVEVFAGGRDVVAIGGVSSTDGAQEARNNTVKNNKNKREYGRKIS